MFTFNKITPLFFVFLICVSCSDDDITVEEPIELTEQVKVYEKDLLNDDLVLAIVNGENQAFIIDKAGNKLKEFEFTNSLGNDLEILPDGRMLGIFKDPAAQITFGGYGGIARLINPDGSIDWEYTVSDEDEILHHDIEMLPNGNILMLIWERIDEQSQEENGSFNGDNIYPEKLVEINPVNNQIVWEWRSWDHIIQDGDPSIDNYGIVSDNPHKLHINYRVATNGDVMHANGIDYDETRDVIFMSVNFWNETWVIDHSTTTAEASSGSGGNYGKGGDLIYRFGNPLAYDNQVGEVRVDRNHFPNLLEDGVPGEGNILLYVNGNTLEQSTILELKMPEPFQLFPNTDNEPELVWSYEHPDLYARFISGATRLPNGNTLICEGDYGFWEVTADKVIVWKYEGEDPDLNFWRAYNYEKSDARLESYSLEN
ncbi:MAG: aryl-sulfate sulfotransferase [Nonlabens sp.]